MLSNTSFVALEIFNEKFRKIERRDMDLEPRIYNLFYTYLVMKERLRSEMVQSNKWVGFENFSIFKYGLW